ncbi:F-box/kelch-repeat protein SKIP11-like [Vicia villosa]|uniref:F-box/kelch-repeat protein SKIP11-like n=1 Tax=Vicia villosa TaxID=3911 RepID=UPI00273AA592|nr:F-box/kelch-repeat protein SKIP11-like [Vicia villosa]
MDRRSNQNQSKVEGNKDKSTKYGAQTNNFSEDVEEKDMKGEEKNNFILHAHSKDLMNKKINVGVTFESSFLIQGLSRDLSIHCLLKLSRSDYGLIATLNKSFRSLIKTGELYKLRKKIGILEHWIYFSSEVLQWEAFDPNRNRWMHLPKINSEKVQVFGSLAVGTELLVIGTKLMDPIIYKYSLLTNTWSVGKMLQTPRRMFGYASLGEIGIIAGGVDEGGKTLSSAELYDSNTGKWETLPKMNTPRIMCSCVFMEGKFYVIGGIGAYDKTHLTCGEEFDMKTKEWRVIPNMFPIQNSMFGAPFIFKSLHSYAAVKNVLYAADYAQQEIKKFDKDTHSWVIIGTFPNHDTSVDVWGLSFHSCGDRLLFFGGCHIYGKDMIEIYSWVADEGVPHWKLLARKKSLKFMHNCAVMGC